MTINKIPGEVLLQDEMMCLRILRRVQNPTDIAAVNLKEDSYSKEFTKAMCLLVKYGLISISDGGKIERTTEGKELLENILEILS